MSASKRTMVFAGVAVACVGIATAAHISYQPAEPKIYDIVGEPFYPDFNDPNSATGLRVAAYNEDEGRTEVFQVEQKDGLWRIPSHHNYPADGREQLSKTASSIIGVSRKALVETSKASHKRYRLLDPLDRDVAGTEGRGDRVTLFKGDEPLVDFIIGEKTEEEGDTYYVRRADEDTVYTADLDVEITTQFADWIEPNLLDVTSGDVRQLVIDRYHVDEDRGVVVREDQSVLKRESASADWTMEDLNEESESLKTSEVTSMLSALRDLKIVGVRPKPPALSAFLRGDARSIPQSVEFDLNARGFYIANSGLVANEGNVFVGTDEGVMYILGFGQEFTGTEVDIEVGSKKSGDEESSEEKTDSEEAASNEETEDSEDEAAEGLQKSRYVFITVQFDESLLGQRPEPPVKPEPPAEADDKADASDEEPADADAEKEADEEAPADTDATADADDAQKAYEEALKQYEADMKKYESDLKAYEARLEDGKERTQELTNRFADWYYVIPADVYDRLRLQRSALIEAKEKEEESTPETPAANPEAMKAPATPDAPAEKPAEEPKPDAKPDPEAEKKPAEEPAKKDESEEKKPAEDAPMKEGAAEKPAETSPDAPAEAKPAEEESAEKPQEASESSSSETKEDAAEEDSAS